MIKYIISQKVNIDHLMGYNQVRAVLHKLVCDYVMIPCGLWATALLSFSNCTQRPKYFKATQILSSLVINNKFQRVGLLLCQHPPIYFYFFCRDLLYIQKYIFLGPTLNSNFSISSPHLQLSCTFLVALFYPPSTQTKFYQ